LNKQIQVEQENWKQQIHIQQEIFESTYSC
jgi:hypothetical protein